MHTGFEYQMSLRCFSFKPIAEWKHKINKLETETALKLANLGWMDGYIEYKSLI